MTYDINVLPLFMVHSEHAIHTIPIIVTHVQ